MVPTRRTVLSGLARGTAASLAGCLAGDDTVSFEAHGASSDVESQPTVGSLDRAGIVVGFEDPSCISCKRFEEDTFPQLHEELIAPGDVAFVYRTLDITYPWGRPASQVLASTYAADEDAFWELKDFYYDNRDRFDEGNVFDETEPYLAESSVDAQAVLDDARAEAHDDWIQQNRDAAEALGVGATPQFYLFRDGEFRTEVAGPQDYDVFASALGFE